METNQLLCVARSLFMFCLSAAGATAGLPAVRIAPTVSIGVELHFCNTTTVIQVVQVSPKTPAGYASASARQHQLLFRWMHTSEHSTIANRLLDGTAPVVPDSHASNQLSLPRPSDCKGFGRTQVLPANIETSRFPGVAGWSVDSADDSNLR